MINVFAGGRRLAVLAAIAVSGLTIAAIAFNTPYLTRQYSVRWPGAALVVDDTQCPEEGRTRYFTRYLPGGTVGVELCLRPMAFDDGQRLLVPFKTDGKGYFWGNEPYSPDVQIYSERLEKDFQISGAELTEVEALLKSAYWKKARETLGYLLVGLAVFWLCVWAVGWIVRGFLGIPVGKDQREKSA